MPAETVDYFTEADVKQLASTMTVHTFEEGDVLVNKEDRLQSLMIIAKGSVSAKNVTLGGRQYDGSLFGPDAPALGFGWQALLSTASSPTHQTHFRGNMIAQTDGVALMLSKSPFAEVMKAHHNDSSTMLEQLAARRLARIELQQMPVFYDSLLDETQIDALLDLMHRFVYIPHDENEETFIFKAGEKIEAALYFVRECSVILSTNKGEDRRLIESGSYFGEQNMLRDQNRDGQKHWIVRSPTTAIAHGSRTVVDVLHLEGCRTVINTRLLGLGTTSDSKENMASIQWADIERHSFLGGGKWGQVWLASIPATADDEEDRRKTTSQAQRQVVALKVQSKYQIIESGEAGRVVAERNILASLKSPFLLQLVHTFQDEDLLYMITSVAQGGELESLIPDDGMCEASAKWYAAGILEGLAWMHRHRLIHRDIKPQNVLINEKGYPVLIDFGFAKYVPDKTFTFVGSPVFTAPEIIRFQGHDKRADYWAWGVLVYRLVTGKYPFYAKSIDELELYRRICKGSIVLDGAMNGWRDIINSPWFVNDEAFDIRRLRKQEMPAPWVPDLDSSLDASSFHPDESEMRDLLHQHFPAVSEKHQQIFASFGPQI